MKGINVEIYRKWVELRVYYYRHNYHFRFFVPKLFIIDIRRGMNLWISGNVFVYPKTIWRLGLNK